MTKYKYLVIGDNRYTKYLSSAWGMHHLYTYMKIEDSINLDPSALNLTIL